MLIDDSHYGDNRSTVQTVVLCTQTGTSSETQSTMSTGNHQAGTFSQFPQVIAQYRYYFYFIQLVMMKLLYKLVQSSYIGKLIELHGCANMKQFSRDEIYCVLKSEPDVHPESYPRTRSHQATRSLFRQFQPSWVKNHPWLHYSHHVDGAYCRACVFVCSRSSFRSHTWPLCNHTIYSLDQNV